MIHPHIYKLKIDYNRISIKYTLQTKQTNKILKDACCKIKDKKSEFDYCGSTFLIIAMSSSHFYIRVLLTSAFRVMVKEVFNASIL